MKINSFFLLAIAILFLASCSSRPVTLFHDDFSGYTVGDLMPHVGPHTEYHYMIEAQPQGAWTMTAFQSRWTDTAWKIQFSPLDPSVKMMSQTINSRAAWTHPMLVAGDSLWQDYSVEAVMRPHTTQGRTGLAFRYQNDKCYYYFGMQDDRAAFIKTEYDLAYRLPNEDTLAITPYAWTADETYTLRVEVQGNRFIGYINGEEVLQASDDRYAQGRVLILSDQPADFFEVTVTGTKAEQTRVAKLNKEREEAWARLQAGNPQPVLWKKIETPGFGTGRNVRFGDLTGDGTPDVLFGQIVQHAYPLDRFSELSCLTAMTFDGKVLWQTGEPDPEKWELTNDVAFQIFDIDRDGKNEVIYTMNSTIYVAEGATGRIKYSAPTPAKKATMYFMDDKNQPMRDFDRILGDCLFFCDLRGVGYPTDLVIKDRYESFWVLDDKLNVRWRGDCRTGHYPYAADLDEDGIDELLIGYSAYDGNGKLLWSWDNLIKDHSDGVAAVDFSAGEGPRKFRIFNAASDEGAIIAGPDGTILKHYTIGHVQNPAIANLRPDLPGLETVTINFWGSQGIMHYFDSDGNIYQMIEPTHYGSLCLPINWRGDGQEFIVLNPNVKEGGMYDGWGRKVVAFPDDGHPDMCNAVLDIIGDARDEVVVWDTESMWVYTQDDSPLGRRLYKPERNPLYNYSNYQLTVSLPGWTE